ncbi:hypothetical protein JW979_08775, partial [bacterium]|nr:hypothetical protein [candidate division CSSED10-310 bacterium]
SWQIIAGFKQMARPTGIQTSMNLFQNCRKEFEKFSQKMDKLSEPYPLIKNGNSSAAERWRLVQQQKAVLNQYRMAVKAMDQSKSIIVFQEELSADLTTLAYLIDGGNPPEALNLLDRAIALDISNGQAWKLKGIMLLNFPEQQHAAVHSFRRYLQISPDSFDSYQIKSIIYSLESHVDSEILK